MAPTVASAPVMAPTVAGPPQSLLEMMAAAGGVPAQSPRAGGGADDFDIDEGEPTFGAADELARTVKASSSLEEEPAPPPRLRPGVVLIGALAFIIPAVGIVLYFSRGADPEPTVTLPGAAPARGSVVPAPAAGSGPSAHAPDRPSPATASAPALAAPPAPEAPTPAAREEEPTREEPAPAARPEKPAPAARPEKLRPEEPAPAARPARSKPKPAVRHKAPSRSRKPGAGLESLLPP